MSRRRRSRVSGALQHRAPRWEQFDFEAHRFAAVVRPLLLLCLNGRGGRDAQQKARHERSKSAHSLRGASIPPERAHAEVLFLCVCAYARSTARFGGECCCVASIAHMMFLSFAWPLAFLSNCAGGKERGALKLFSYINSAC